MIPNYEPQHPGRGDVPLPWLLDTPWDTFLQIRVAGIPRNLTFP